VPFKTISFALGTCLLILLSPGSAFSQTVCPDFPKVDFWGEMSHVLVRQHVADSFSGNWGPYISRLKRRHAALSRISGRGKAARVSRDGRRVVLKGARLSQYLGFSSERIKVVECLAKSASAGNKPGKQALSTPPEKSPRKKNLSDKEQVKRTYLTLPKSLLDKLRQEAVRRSKEENRSVSVNDIILETVKKELRRRNR
jgi:hypothetical protein